MSNSKEDNKENEARQNQVKEYLKTLEFREIYGDLISSCTVRNIRVVGDYLYLKLFLGSDQIKLKDIIENKLKNFSWAKKVYLDLKFIKGVKRTIAIGSGKGGVGKSSITLGLALNLKKRGYKVGILDADVYGPNIPIIAGLKKQDVLTKEENGITKFIALDHEDLKIMSVAMLAKSHQSLAWRGPILTRLLNQFLYQVDWGELDFLLIDLPPGTGDTQITLLQDSPTVGVILVTLPGSSSYSDLIRTISMYENFGMPIYGLVENMSFYKCPCCSHEEKLFIDETTQNETIQNKYDILTSLPFINTKLHTEGINLFLKKENSKYFDNICSSIEQKVNFAND